MLTLLATQSSSGGIIFTMFFFVIFGLIMLLNLAHFLALIFAVIDIAKTDRRVKMDNNKTAWVLILIFVPLGPIIYFLAGRDNA